MNVYNTDEEQAEVIRKWWAENGRFLIAGVVLGIALLVGWNQWKAYQERTAQAASWQYQQLERAVSNRAFDQVASLGASLRAEYAGSAYATLGALLQAKALTQQGQLDAAAEQLRWASTNGKTLELRELSRLRLAQVLTADGKAEEALTLLQGDWPSGYTSLLEEYRGDALRKLGRIDEARAAYDRALLTAGAPVEYLRLKREDLGSARESES
ncbi:MAG: YfgM family protein [Thiotrichales bacterium]